MTFLRRGHLPDLEARPARRKPARPGPLALERSWWAAGAAVLVLLLVWSGLVVVARAPSATAIGPRSSPASPGGESARATLGTYQASSLTSPAEVSAEATLDLLRFVVPPPRDEADLVRRFKRGCGETASPPISLAPAAGVGTSRTFWVYDEPARRYFQATATLRHTSRHLAHYVEDGVAIGQGALTASAQAFEQRTYPTLARYFGELPPGTHVSIFNGKVPGVGGYFSAPDLLPRDVNPFSNELPLVYMNTGQTRPGTALYDAVLAHEVQHIIHALLHPHQDAWINEGASEVAMALVGHDMRAPVDAFLRSPDTQLNRWVESPAAAVPYYGAAYLWLEYFAQRLGGHDVLRELIATPGQGLRLFERYLARHTDAPLLEDLFRDWTIANLLNDPTLADGRYGYHDAFLTAGGRGRPRAQPQQRVESFPATSASAVAQFATRYVEFVPPPGGSASTLELAFTGSPEARLVAADPTSGRALWWGNAADAIESTLTREVDLTTVESATLRFRAWFDIERDFDYAGVAVSENGGCTWHGLAGRHTTDADPLGHNVFSHAYTGRSGGAAVWIEDEMDLTPFAGGRVLLRFFYATDQGYYGPGFAVDDIGIAAIAFFDDAEEDRGWDSRGFLRGTNALPQTWVVQVVTAGPGVAAGTEVAQLPLARLLDESGARDVEGRLAVAGFGDAVTRVVVAISPLAPATQEPSAYQLQATLR